jgi:WD40 repeat protein/serine/threonine protein kinase
MNVANPSAEDPLVEIADAFVEAFRQGKRPSVEEFAQRYPEHADRLRELLPALVLMEEANPPADSSAGPATMDAASALPLRQLGDFQIVREIGRGGMGVVYEATQISLGRHVALKVLPPHALLDPRHLSRFKREARSAAKLHHTNIVPVFGIGEQDGMHYYVMQFIQGLGLDEVLLELRRLRRPHDHGSLTPNNDRPERTRDASAAGVARSLLTGQVEPAAPQAVAHTLPPLPPGSPGPAADVPGGESVIHLPGQSETTSLGESGRQLWQSVARIGIQVASALDYAAGHGVLHRDIKPSNLLLDAQGNVWVTDFGLAKGLADTDNLTHTGDLIGTLRYMAPERFSGQGDLRSDLYALGLTLYELLTLRPAFAEADRNKLVRQVMHDEPPRPRKLDPAVPRDLETIVLKAIDRDPARRYQAAVEMGADLHRFLEDRPIRARRVSELEKFVRWCRRNPIPASLLAALMVVFLIGFAAVSWQWRMAESARNNEQVQRNRAESGEADATAARERAEQALYFSNIARAQLEYRANNLAGAEAILDHCPVERRGWEWHYLKGLNHADLLTLTGHTDWVEAVAYSPDGKLIASAGGGNPFWSTQGLDSIRPGQVILWDAASGKRLRTLEGHKHRALGVAFSPDGQRLATACLDGMVRIWNVSAGQELFSTSVTSGASCVAFSPDGQLLAAGGYQGGVVVWDAANGRERLRCGASQHGVASLTFSPDSRRLASISFTQSEHANVLIWDVATGKEAQSLDCGGRFPGNGYPMALSPDGRYVAAPESDLTIKIWDLSSGRPLRSLAGHLGYLRGLAFSPDGLSLASASDDSTIRIWDVGTGQESVVLRGHTWQVHGIAFNSDGTRLASAGADYTVRIWDLTLHPEFASLHARQYRNLTQDIEALGFSEDGQAITLAKRRGWTLTYQATNHTLLDCRDLELTWTWFTGEPACLDAHGRWLAGVSQEGPTVVKCFDLTTGKEHLVLSAHEVAIRHVTLTPGARRIATGSRWTPSPDKTGEVKVWDGETGQLLFALIEKGLGITRLALSPEGDRLAVAGIRATADPGGRAPRQTAFLTVFALPDGQTLRHFIGGDSWWSLTFSPDGRRLAAATLETGNVLLWDLATDERTIRRRGPDVAMDAAFSPDGRRLAVAGRHLVQLLDAQTGEEILGLRGEAHVTGGSIGYNPRVRWSPDGRLLAATCGNTVSIWSAAGEGTEERAARCRAAERRAVVHHLTLGHSRFHLDRLRTVTLETPWEYVQRGLWWAQAGEEGLAEADLARAAELAPRAAAAYVDYGNLLAQRGSWKKASAQYARALAATSWNSDFWGEPATVFAYLGQQDLYRQSAGPMVRRFEKLKESEVLRLCRVIPCLLHPDPDIDVQLLGQAADQLLVHVPDGFLVKALAEYRAGHFESALAWLKKAGPKLGKDNQTWETTWYHLARTLAFARLHKVEEGRSALREAVQLLDRRFNPEHGPFEEGWPWWLACQTLRREAEAVLHNARPRSELKR